MKASVVLCLLCACLAFPPPAPAPVATPMRMDPVAMQQQRRANFARSSGYPTRRTQADLDEMIAQHTAKYARTGRRGVGRLEAPEPFTIEGTRDTCYKVVIRLADGATWGPGAEAGLRFDFRGSSGNGSGGPGLRGPGAVASVGCAAVNGTITLTMRPMVGDDPIGQGAFKFELWSHHLSTKESAERSADIQRQLDEQREFQSEEARKQRDREIRGCGKCDGRYQGCIGAGRSESSCRSAYSSCTFEEVGAESLSVCPSPR